MTAASRGMGAACAREIARRGFDLALMARGDDVNALAAELNAVAAAGSVTEEQDLRRFVEAALGRYGRLDRIGIAATRDGGLSFSFPVVVVSVVK